MYKICEEVEILCICSLESSRSISSCFWFKSCFANAGDEHGADRSFDDVVAREDGGLIRDYTRRVGVGGVDGDIRVSIL